MPAPKTSSAARQLIRERIMAGDSNVEIRQRLQDAGHPPDISRQLFAYYRSDKVIQEALAQKTEEALQAGFAQRSQRILALAQSARRLERRLALSTDDPDFAPGKPASLVTLHREFRETLKDIGTLVDPAKTHTVHVNATLETIGAAAEAADARFAAVLARAGAPAVLDGPDGGGAGSSEL